MGNKTELARRSLRAVMKVRRANGISRTQPICIYDLAERLGVSIRFTPEKSLGGMFAKASNTILVPTFRPPGRQAFTCAHELGHWHFGHGNRIEELDIIERYSSSDSEEWIADRFASFLLMPHRAIEHAFLIRGLNPASCDPVAIYRVACQFGVGYSTLVNHLHWSLDVITRSRSDELLKTSPKQLREMLLGTDPPRHLVILDRAWTTINWRGESSATTPFTRSRTKER